MGIKDILVHADNSETFESRLSYSIALAQEHKAHLTALYVIPNTSVPGYAGIYLDKKIIQPIVESIKEDATSAKSVFEKMTHDADIDTEWRLEKGYPLQALNKHGCYYDLVVLSQTNPKWDDDIMTGLADDLVISLGRPSLVLPYVGAAANPPKRVLVAWNGSHSATRAVNDALPLLKAADYVEVVSINPEKGKTDEGELPSADICLHLARHGVVAMAKGIHAKDISDGDLLLSHASDMGAELLVMGAYGHSRFREFVLSGATRHLLRHMTIPVFMSH